MSVSLSNSAQMIRKSATVVCVTTSSAWLGGILYSYYSLKNSKKMSNIAIVSIIIFLGALILGLAISK